MKITMSVAQNSLPALSSLAALALPALSAYKVATLLRKLKDPLTTFDDTRGKLLKEVGEPAAELDKDGNPVLDENGAPKLKDGEFKIVDMERWTTEMTALLEADIELAVSTIKVSELGTVAIEPRILVALDWCIGE